MLLEAIDRDLLEGAHGAAAARAMAMLVRYGEARKAERFIPIQSAHIDSCLYHGPSSVDFARRYAQLGGRVRVPTTLNVGAVDTLHPGVNCGRASLVPVQKELTELYVQLGCVPTLTCAPYQRRARPGFGDHVAWAESNAIAFVNSVLGARTDRYGDFTDLFAALTGRVPLAGLHLDAQRRPTVGVEVIAPDDVDLPRDVYFACVGYVLGARVAGKVPLLCGLPDDSSEDELKALGAAAASSGSIALFHVLGVTPEARTLAAATQGHEVAHGTPISAADLHAALSKLCPLEEGEAVAAMCLGTPHFSMEEFRGLGRALRGRKPAPGVEVYVSTSREIASAVQSDPVWMDLEAFGVRIVVDVCTYLAPVVRSPEGAIVTNSGKYAHYGPGNIGRRIGLMSLERCIRSVEQGRVAP